MRGMTPGDANDTRAAQTKNEAAKRPAPRGWHVFPPRARNRPGTFRHVVLITLEEITKTTGVAVGRGAWYAAYRAACVAGPARSDDLFDRAVTALVRNGDVLIVSDPGVLREYARSTMPVPSSARSAQHATLLRTIREVVGALCADTNLAVSTSAIHRAVRARYAATAATADAAGSPTRVQLKIILNAARRASARDTQSVREPIPADGPVTRGAGIEMVSHVHEGRTTRYWRPMGSTFPCPGPRQSQRYLACEAVTRVEALLGHPVSVRDIWHWQDACRTTDSIAGTLRREGLRQILEDISDDVRWTGGKPPKGGRTPRVRERARLAMVRTVVACPSGPSQRWTARFLAQSEVASLPQDAETQSFLCWVQPRMIHVDAFGDAVVAAVCRVLDMIAALLPATERAALSACAVLAERVGSPILHSARSEREQILRTAATAAIWGAQHAAESHTTADGVVRAVPVTDIAVVKNIFAALEHSVQTREAWANQWVPVTTRRYERLVHLGVVRQHAHAVRHIVMETLGQNNTAATTAARQSAAGSGVAASAFDVHAAAKVGEAGVLPLPDVSPMLRSITQPGTGISYQTVLKPVRRVPTPLSRLQMPASQCVDRVDSVLAAVDTGAGPRGAAAVSAARTLLGTVVRDAGWLRGLIAAYPDDGYGRRAAILALGMLGEIAPLEQSIPDPQQPLDVAAACLASVLATIAPTTESATWLEPTTPGVTAFQWANPQLPTPPGIDWYAMEHAIRAIETHVLAAAGADASFEVARHALARVRERCWWRVIDG